jgi:hypothetical protein
MRRANWRRQPAVAKVCHADSGIGCATTCGACYLTRVYSYQLLRSRPLWQPIGDQEQLFSFEARSYVRFESGMVRSRSSGFKRRIY